MLCLDFDGTLAPIVEHPEDARPLPAALDAVDALAARLGCIAVVTGRPVRTVLELGGLDRLTNARGLRVYGQYGAERWDGASGRVVAPDRPASIGLAVERIGALVEGAAAAGEPVEGARLEDKGLAVGVHTRSCADPAAALGALEPGLRALADELGLVVEPGRNVVELRSSALTKGDAVRGLVGEFEPAALAFCGDDAGDIAGFDAVRAWRGEGRPGAVVVSGSVEVPALAERADVLCAGPAGIAAWLGSLADRLAAGGPSSIG
ncbi:trehalose-phosphatase [Propionibacterium acidifaciens]